MAFSTIPPPRIADRRSPAPKIGRARLNSSHVSISYAVFCLKKKKGYRPDNLCAYAQDPAVSLPPAAEVSGCQCDGCENLAMLWQLRSCPLHNTTSEGFIDKY